jgi:AraC-like DNA-binding protein
MSPGEVNGPRVSYIQSVYLIEQGEGKFSYDGYSVDLFPNVLVYLPSGKAHSIISSRNNPIVFKCVFFEWNYQHRDGVKVRNDYLPEVGSVTKDYIEPLNPLNILEYMVLKDPREWNFLFNHLKSNVDVYQPSHFPESLKIQGKFYAFLDYVLSISNSTKSLSDVRIQKVLKQIEDMSGDFEDKNIEVWAKKFNLSRSYFQHIFKKETGYTPNVFWNSVRINRTINDLIETNKTITKISEIHDFKSVHYYSKLFRKVMGTTPNEFRRRYRLNG